VVSSNAGELPGTANFAVLHAIIPANCPMIVVMMMMMMMMILMMMMMMRMTMIQLTPNE